MPDDVRPSTAFAKTVRNKVKRVHERGQYERRDVYAILDAAMLCHVAYVFDGQPYCTPTSFWREGDHLYWHGSSASRMLRVQKPGIPVCLTVAHLDSLVLARSGFHHSVDYRSAMCFGNAHIIEDAAEKVRALDSMIDRFYPERAASLRPITAQEMKATMVIGMSIEDAVGKVRDSGVGDDEDDYALPIYAAKFPIRMVVDAVETCPRMPAGVPRPDGLSAFQPGRRLDEALLENWARTYGSED